MQMRFFEGGDFESSLLAAQKEKSHEKDDRIRSEQRKKAEKKIRPKSCAHVWDKNKKVDAYLVREPFSQVKLEWKVASEEEKQIPESTNLTSIQSFNFIYRSPNLSGTPVWKLWGKNLKEQKVGTIWLRPID